jgi:hypothetical protein
MRSADDYSARAEECRSRAEITRDPQGRDGWLMLASVWAKLAQHRALDCFADSKLVKPRAEPFPLL